MVRQHPIKCNHCGQDSGYTQEGIRYLVIMHDMNCQKCGKVVLKRLPVYELKGQTNWNDVRNNKFDATAKYNTEQSSGSEPKRNKATMLVGGVGTVLPPRVG